MDKSWLVTGCFTLLLAANYSLVASLASLSDRNRHRDAVDKFFNLLTAYLSGKILPSDLMLGTTGLAWNISHDKKFKRVADALEVLVVQLGNGEITEAEFKAQLLESIKSAK